MQILPNNPKIIVQGLTGVEGRACLPGMMKYGTQIIAGVTPGKGGQFVENIPIFNSVREAQASVGQVDGTVQFVPPAFTKSAVMEAFESEIKFILIGAEKVPVKDASIIVAASKKYNAMVIGPGSVGCINPHKQIKIGAIGGSSPDRVFSSGNVAIISKSGGMTSEIGLLLKNHGLGVSWAIGIGGERLVATDFVDILQRLDSDENTAITVLFGELGGMYEEKVSRAITSGKIKKPIVGFIAGEFAMTLPQGVQFGHAGAIIEGKYSTPQYKRTSLESAGAVVVQEFDQIPAEIKKILS